jgi:fructose-1,6-bisphosphatase I
MAQQQSMITTVQQHILQQQKNFPDATGTFSWLLSGVTLAAKMIEAKIRSAGLSDILGAYGQMNVQGEQQQKLDVYANRAMEHCLGLRDSVAALVSEEDDEPVVFNRDGETGKYIIVFDPLDGSSNIDVNVNVGTIFSVFRRPQWGDVNTSVLQQGIKQVAAGYVLYGPSTILVYTTGHGVHGFTLDQTIGAFLLSWENMRMPESGPYYSVNEANLEESAPEYTQFVHDMRAGKIGDKHGSRYIGSLVADFHRTLLKGGIFFYPPTTKVPTGKLRLMYEANPLAFIAEQAGGMATNGIDRILDIKPEAIHQRTPLAIGSKVEVEALRSALAK